MMLMDGTCSCSSGRLIDFLGGSIKVDWNLSSSANERTLLHLQSLTNHHSSIILAQNTDLPTLPVLPRASWLFLFSSGLLART